MFKQDLVDLSLEELQEFCLLNELPKFRATQIWRWVYCFGLSSFDDMNNIAKSTRNFLNQISLVSRPEVSEVQESKDGTIKWLIKLKDNSEVETVFIPQDDRGTVCLSSQVGCTLNCTFCHTGTQALVRNLTSSEILGQLMLVMDHLDDWPSGKNTRKVTNVVMMGMGEPLTNYNNVVHSLEMMLDDQVYGLSRRKVTLSTSGLIPAMDKLKVDCPVALAVSLHAPNNSLRDQIVPINKKYPLKDLMSACLRYIENAPRDFVTFEYVMLKSVNDSIDQAKELIDLVKDVPCKFNLIPFNSFPNSGYKCSDRGTMSIFKEVLADEGIITTIRKTRGDDIAAACGQLAGQVQDKTKRSQKISFVSNN